MAKTRSQRSLNNETSESADLSVVRLVPEYDPIKCTSRRQQEVDSLIVQILLASRKRGRPRKTERNDDQ